MKAGEKAVVAGKIEYGGSKHVATALLSVNKKYSKIQSAINLKFRESTISKIKKMKWNTKNLIVVIAASIIPFGTFYIDYKYLQ